MSILRRKKSKKDRLIEALLKLLEKESKKK
jgi:hypothetical protein